MTDFLVTFLAEAGPALSAEIGSYAQLGVMGVTLWWFMQRMEPRLRSMESTIDRQSRAILVVFIDSPFTSESKKAVARAIVAEVDSAEEARNKQK